LSFIYSENVRGGEMAAVAKSNFLTAKQMKANHLKDIEMKNRLNKAKVNANSLRFAF
jgi:hypothetical protein